MLLQSKTLEKLRRLINEETEYRSGPQLVSFFNDLGFNDEYGRGFPSRWIYTDGKLEEINGTPKLDKCIRKVFAPVNFISRFKKLDDFISEFNQYLAFDGFKVVRNDKEISFAKADSIDFSYESEPVESAEEIAFLNKEFGALKLSELNLDDLMYRVVQMRADEMKSCLRHRSPLALIFLCGSTAEGLLLNAAKANPQLFNQSRSTPKDEQGKVLPFRQWRLKDLIDVACEVGFIGQDVKKFGHALRDFRNYIHPNQQVLSNFDPDQRTAKVCWQVFQALVEDLRSQNSS
jgi:hypothetical protein